MFRFSKLQEYEREALTLLEASGSVEEYDILIDEYIGFYEVSGSVR